jgi:hypothetical protein
MFRRSLSVSESVNGMLAVVDVTFRALRFRIALTMADVLLPSSDVDRYSITASAEIGVSGES